MTHHQPRTPNSANSQVFKKVYNLIYREESTLAKVRDAALAERLLDYTENSLEVKGRSLAWKLFLISDEPLKTSSSELRVEALSNSLRSSRKRYANMLTQKMRAPDGSYAEGFSVPGSSSSPTSRRESSSIDLERNNPLSLHNDNPWTEWFAALELRKTISQDVERTFPEIDFFRNPDVQDQLTNILYLYSAMNPAIGYRQGMHELLAPLYYAVDVDSLQDTDTNPLHEAAVELCSNVWVAADAWALFDSVMRSVSRWYEWRESPSESPPSPLSHHVQLNPDGQAELKPYIAPIVQACNHIQSSLLRTTDPLLWRHLQSSGLEPQIYGIRWLRLLFTREYSMPDAMRLWDALFACDPGLDLVPWICVAMLIRIRNVLIPSDYTAQLTALLRYPTPPVPESTTTHHTTLLMRQALALQMAPTPATGVSVVMENWNLLNIPVDIPEPPPAPRKRSFQHAREKSGGQTRQQTPQAQAQGFPEMLARGLLERGESLGLNKSLLTAVTELRRNIPELAASFVRSPLNTPSIPMTDERHPEERPPWEPKSRLELEREMNELRMNNKRLGESLGWVVDTLLQDEGSSDDPLKLKKRKQEALESLSYVRDVLFNGFTEVEDDRLYGEEETAKRKLKAQMQTRAVTSHPLDPPPPRAPAPVPVVDTHVRQKSTPTGFTPQHSISHQSPQSPSVASSSAQTPTWSPNTTRLAPWNYTKSSFSGEGSSLPAASLPRLPPPTSNTFQRPPASSVPSPAQRDDGAAKAPPRRNITPDPLGVLK